MSVSEKHVLCCMGERRRPITFSYTAEDGKDDNSGADDGKTELDSLTEAVRCVFQDLIPRSSRVFLQIKSEEWEGTFVDISGTESIPNHAVIRAVVEKPSPQESSECKQAAEKCIQLSKPTEREAKELGKLFPSCTGTSSKRGQQPLFDPRQELHGLPDKKKKKRASTSQGRPVTVTVCCLARATPFIPKGKVRNDLKKKGRIQSILLTRSMSSVDVSDSITRAFSGIIRSQWVYLEAGQDNRLTETEQSLDGNAACSRRGCLYIMDKQNLELSASGNDDTATSPKEAVPIPAAEVVVLDEDETSDQELQLPLVHFGQLDNVQCVDLEETRHIVDQAKATEQATKEHLRQMQRRLRLKFQSRDEGPQCAVCFRLPGGQRLEHSFSVNVTIQELYEYVFSTGLIEDSFTLCTAFPRQDLMPSEQSAGSCGVITVEIRDDSPELLATFGEVPSTFDSSDEPGENQCTADLDVLKRADCTRLSFVEALSLGNGKTHVVDRARIFEDVITLYATELHKIVLEFPFRTAFAGEKAIDFGGVTRDVFSAFFEEAYIRLFDGTSLLTPADFPNVEMPPLVTLGAIISHAYLMTGVLPVKVAFPALAAMLLPNLGNLPDEILTTSFIDSLSCLDASIFREAIIAVKADVKSFSMTIQSGLVNVLSRFGVRELPSPNTLMKLIAGVAKYHFLRKPASAIADISSGIPDMHVPFWRQMHASELYSIYKAQQASPAKVLAMLDAEVVTMNPNEERVLSYVEQFIGNMKEDEVRAFLRFVTGSAVCSANVIHINFNQLEGFARRPIAHTCTCTLELPSTYRSYLDFSAEFQGILQDNEFAWKMDSV